MVVGVIHAWVLEIPLVWLFAYNFDFGPTGVWWGQVIAIAGAGLMLLYWFSRKRWLERVV
jgi:MATE family multidrug resistance protein